MKLTSQRQYFKAGTSISYSCLMPDCHLAPFPATFMCSPVSRDSTPNNHFSQDLLSSGFLFGFHQWKTLAWDVEDRKQKPLFFSWQQPVGAWTLAEWKFWVSFLGSVGGHDHWQRYPAVPTLGISNKVLVLWRLEANLTARGKPPCPMLLPFSMMS